VNDKDCAGRAKSALGSSSSWGPGKCPDNASPVCAQDGGNNGMISNSSAQNPYHFNWNHVFIGCECMVKGSGVSSAQLPPFLEDRSTHPLHSAPSPPPSLCRL
jgi:hypothetical protein